MGVSLKEKIDSLYNDFNQVDKFLLGNEKNAAISQILQTVQNEFLTLQTKLNTLITKIKDEKNSEISQFKVSYESKVAAVKNSSNILRFDDIPWPCDGTIDEMITVLLHGVDKGEIRKTIHLHQKFWHPDKFNQLFLTRLCSDDSEKIIEKVHLISAGLNAKLE